MTSMLRHFHLSSIYVHYSSIFSSKESFHIPATWTFAARCLRRLCRVLIFGLSSTQLTMPFFVIERIAALLLAASNDFRVSVFKETTVSNPFQNISPDVIDNLTALKGSL